MVDSALLCSDTAVWRLEDGLKVTSDWYHANITLKVPYNKQLLNTSQTDINPLNHKQTRHHLWGTML
jgi:hypothetical protein